MPPKKPSGPTPVEAITHADKRANLPTADAQDLVSPDIDADLTVRYPRNLSTPMLVWQGKEEADQDDLTTEAPPIYIQEKIDPRAIIDDLKKHGASNPAEAPTLFDSFDGLTDLDLVEFYKHEANWSNRMILGDSLQVMASLDSRERLRGKVQMIYMDPPYGIKFGSNWQVSTRRRDVRDGKLEDLPREVEQIKAFRDTWELGVSSYLSYLRDRLLVSRDLLAESGSVLVQIGDENVHRVRCLLDEVFGPENFVSQITFGKTATTTGEGLAATGDFMLWYARSKPDMKYRQLYATKIIGGAGGSLYGSVLLGDGTRRPLRPEERADSSTLPEGALIFGLDNLTSPRVRSNRTGYFPVELDGRSFLPAKGEWKTHASGMARLKVAGRLSRSGTGLGYLRFADDFPVFPLSNIWTDTVGQNQYAGDKLYVVQTALRVVQRCMLMATDPGDLVLDPTCGSGSTAYVAEQWGRRWITIDTSRVALALARQRVMGARFPYYLLRDSQEGRKKEVELSATPPPPAEVHGDIRQGFVYERVQHITLKSIANNPDIVDGMSREQIDAAIKRHAEYEELVDRPYEDKRKVRVTGPFTVESLSPHRSLAFAPSSEPVSEREAAKDPDAPTFEQTILDNLRAAGVQNGRKAERLTFDDVESYAGLHIQAVGTREGDGAGPSRVGVSIGPQYGTVSAKFVKDAAREATKASDIDLLCILGFAFDPQVLGAAEEFAATDESFDVAAERSLGRVPVLLVRMNADLVMGEELKKTGAGNLFTVFGEPDITLSQTDDGQLTVEIRGVDVYDPTIGEVRSGGTDQIALWMIDTDYDEESFFVRHCYFTGGQDPYKRLKQALKADIDEEAWSSLYQTASRPFPAPSTGKIAVKVINDYGDEVVKVLDVEATLAR
ncbi:site-specific DNA-methyltransferase [Acidiferrimicrobium sp. IK]|uniref:site-specific DNA-methyltransferase n=1 Tax=Acidiferrimicrobium sp. IK TaxID=2871700 RepID=UPI0021CB4FC4|nr:site-specific DNA-methyltransferase [Acidiferrimicrobium sp. IK]MCU4187225.1 site-specific DNA-methyltransferase [Acidiferrimicrobium sp. IK]